MIIEFIISNWVYLLWLSLSVSMLLIATRLLLRRIEKKHHKRVSAASGKLPLAAETLRGDPHKAVKKKALHSIRVRYTVIRHLATAGIVLLVSLAVAFPLLGAVSATLLSGLIAMFGIIIGIVAKPVLENLVAGLMLTLSRVINVADTVIINGQYGTIEDVTATHMVIKLWDWRRYIVPNAKVISTEFINLTLYDSYQWAKVEFWIANDADVDLVEREALAAARNCKKMTTDEEPHFWVNEIQKDGIQCWITAWAENPTNAWELKHELRVQLLSRLREHHVCPHRFYLDVGSDAEGADGR